MAPQQFEKSSMTIPVFSHSPCGSESNSTLPSPVQTFSIQGSLSSRAAMLLPVVASPSWPYAPNHSVSTPAELRSASSPRHEHQIEHKMRPRTNSLEKDNLLPRSSHKGPKTFGQPYDRNFSKWSCPQDRKGKKHNSDPGVLSPVDLADQVNTVDHEPMGSFVCSVNGCGRAFADMFSLSGHLAEHALSVKQFIETSAPTDTVLIDGRRKSL